MLRRVYLAASSAAAYSGVSTELHSSPCSCLSFMLSSCRSCWIWSKMLSAGGTGATSAAPASSPRDSSDGDRPSSSSSFDDCSWRTRSWALSLGRVTTAAAIAALGCILVAIAIGFLAGSLLG
uniref:Uncharacterized protein n=1 Tax=Anopheles melas TaxID=34690 RepID=A0A182U170_9DIPT